MARMTKEDARTILSRLRLTKETDFHTLPASKVEEILTEADLLKYRKPKDANGSRGRYFFERLCRVANQKHTEYIVQGHYGQGWEDETAEDTRKDALQRLKEYRANMPEYPHRLITRRVAD